MRLLPSSLDSGDERTWFKSLLSHLGAVVISSLWTRLLNSKRNVYKWEPVHGIAVCVHGTSLKRLWPDPWLMSSEAQPVSGLSREHLPLRSVPEANRVWAGEEDKPHDCSMCRLPQVCLFYPAVVGNIRSHLSTPHRGWNSVSQTALYLSRLQMPKSGDDHRAGYKDCVKQGFARAWRGHLPVLH